MANSIPTGGKRYSDLPVTENIKETDEMFMLRDNAGSRINMETFTSAIASKTTGVDGLISDAFDPEREYDNGEYCIYDNTLYKFTENKDAGEWDPDAATQVKVADEIRDIYPVGSIYMSVTSTDPSTLFGGTWEQIEDVFLLAAGSTYGAGSTGGAATVALASGNIPSHTHSIPALSGTAASAGTHRHDINYYANAVASGSNYSRIGSGGSETSSNTIDSAGAHTHSVTTTASTTGSTGSGTAHENMPPYLAVYMWQRIA